MTGRSPNAVRLRPTAPDDIPFVVATEAAPESRIFVQVWTEGEHRAALENSDVAHFIIVDQASERPVGFVILAGLASRHRSIELRRVVVTTRGAGYGRAAVRIIKDHAFRELGAHRLWLDVLEENTRARRLYISEGFVEEGALRECFLTDAGFKTLVVMSILASDYEGPDG